MEKNKHKKYEMYSGNTSGLKSYRLNVDPEYFYIQIEIEGLTKSNCFVEIQNSQLTVGVAQCSTRSIIKKEDFFLPQSRYLKIVSKDVSNGLLKMTVSRSKNKHKVVPVEALLFKNIAPELSRLGRGQIN